MSRTTHPRLDGILARQGLLALPLALLGLAVLPGAPVIGDAEASSTGAGDEFMSAIEAAPPNIVFLLDLSNAMGDGCDLDLGDGDTSYSGLSCLDHVTAAVDQLTQHYDWAYFAVVGTTYSPNDNTFEQVTPLGASYDDIHDALDGLSANGTDTRNLAEALTGLADEYFSISTENTSDPWQDAPLDYSCQETHVITITIGPPSEDASPVSSLISPSGMSSNTICDADYLETTDEWCLYDNAVYNLYNNFDARSDLGDDQYVTTHTVAIGVDGSSLSEGIYGNASEQTGGEGIYTVANHGGEVLAKLMWLLSDIRQGFYSRSAPVITSDGSYMIYSFYEIGGITGPSDERGSPLGQGHVRAYSIQNDPSEADYGQVQYDGDPQFGGALWDAGDLLVSRPVLTEEDNPMDQDGFGQRDIFTFDTELASEIGSGNDVWAEDLNGAVSTTRMNFDANWVDAVDSNSLIDKYLSVASATDHDFDEDTDVDADDLQALVDFARGLPEATFRYLDQERGYWKLGDSPYAVPVVVTARNNVYTSDPTYRRFLAALTHGPDEDPDLFPDMVLLPANDGMLHAFSLEDYLDPPASSLSTDEDNDQAGEELWAWMLAGALYGSEEVIYDADDNPDGIRDEWSGSLADLMVYGRTFLFDGSPVVEDVWIDANNDGAKTCSRTNFPVDCEWHRVVVVSQGKGGPNTLALDITVPSQPEFLWEHMDLAERASLWDEDVGSAYTTSRPVVVNLYDRETTHGAVHDRWVAIWGSGRAVPYIESSDYYANAEANLFFRHLSDDFTGQYSDGVTFSSFGSNGHPEAGTTSGLDSDGDGRYEFGYISGALAAVDVNSDGDVDVLYFPVTTSYEPADQQDPDEDGLSGTADSMDPGATWMYKAVINTEDLDDPTWCEFVDPIDFGVEDNDGKPFRPEVYYAATTSWHTDGTLGVYWGSGSPYSRLSSEPGFFFGFIDESPLSCPTTATPICNTEGFVSLDDGEGLTGDPIVYQGVVYFPTYAPNTDRCVDGEGRIYGLDFEDCGSGLDLDGDGTADADYTDTDGYPSSVVVTDFGTVLWATNQLTAGNVVESVSPMSDPFNGVATLMLREVFP